ncbi:MAG: hypothetical protein ABI878_15025 [Acidobacteriota bacterium]
MINTAKALSPILLFLTLSVSFFGQSRLDSKIGSVNSTSNGRVCLAIQNSRLKAGQKVSVIFTSRPQSIKSAFVSKKVAASCSSEIDVAEHVSFYLLRMRKVDFPFVEIGYVGTSGVMSVRGVATADLNADGKKEYFRNCTSGEGVHLTVWTGHPLVGRRVWHSYYYLSYDTEPTCKKKDYEGTDN